MGRLDYYGYRLLQTIVLLFIILTFLFFMMRSLPGGYTSLMLAEGASPEVVESFEQKWGLNDPLHVQYARYITNFVMLDVGTSMQSRLPVIEVVGRRILNSLILIVPAVTFAYLLGSTIGAIAGSNRGSWFEEHGLVLFIMIGVLPSFFTSILLVVIFSSTLNWFPAGGLVDPTLDVTGYRRYLTRSFAWHYVLPFTAVVLRITYLPMLVMRTNVVEILGQEFVRYYRLTGYPRRKRLTQVMKHASLPVITLYPIQLARGISGLVLIETVFNWPGIGWLLVQAVLSRDYPVVQFVFFLTAAVVIFGNFVVDTVYGMIDPRVSVEGEE